MRRNFPSSGPEFASAPASFRSAGPMSIICTPLSSVLSAKVLSLFAQLFFGFRMPRIAA